VQLTKRSVTDGIVVEASARSRKLYQIIISKLLKYLSANFHVFHFTEI